MHRRWGTLLPALALALIVTALLAACGSGAPAAPTAKPAAPAATTAPGAAKAPAAEKPAAPAEKPAAAAPKSGAPRELVVATWGGTYEQGVRKVAEKFEKENNVKVITDPGNNADRLNKLRSYKNNPQVDVAFLTDYFAAMAIKEGIFDQIKPAELTNLSKLYDFARPKDGYGPAYTVNRAGIIYNTKQLKEPITSWNDLWRPELKGKVTISDIDLTHGIAFLVTAAELNGGSAKNVDPGFEAIKRLKPNIVKFYRTTAEETQLLQREEAWVGQFMDIFVKDLKDMPMKWIAPKEGALGNVNSLNVTKGSKNRDLAVKFIDYWISTEAQVEGAKLLNDGPTNKEVKLSPEVAANVTYGDEAMKGIKTVDWDYLLTVRDQWIERWNKEITK